MTKSRVYALAALVVAAACAEKGEAPAAANGEPAAALAQQPVSAAQATAGKPLVHVWKSPT